MENDFTATISDIVSVFTNGFVPGLVIFFVGWCSKKLLYFGLSLMKGST